MKQVTLLALSLAAIAPFAACSQSDALSTSDAGAGGHIGSAGASSIPGAGGTTALATVPLGDAAAQEVAYCNGNCSGSKSHACYMLQWPMRLRCKLTHSIANSGWHQLNRNRAAVGRGVIALAT